MATKKKLAIKKAARSAERPAKESKVDNICFTIMPYGDWPDYYYETIYSPAIKTAGLTPRRADDFNRPSAITHDIWVLTNQAKVILADLSGKNPNVFYELGLGHALAKPAILITDAMEEIPFDLRSLRIIVYNKNQPDWGILLQEAIQTAIREVLASPSEAVLPTFLLENQIQSLRQDLDQVKRIESPLAVGGAGRTTKPRMTLSEALAYARRSLDKKAPDNFVLSVLEDNGFQPDLAHSILESAKTSEASQLLLEMEGDHD
jgi:hypothetical protein